MQNKWLKPTVALALLLMCISKGYAATGLSTSIAINELAENTSLNSNFYYSEQKAGISPQAALQLIDWKKSDKVTTNLGITNNDYWLKFNFNNNSSQTISRYLALKNILLVEVEFYLFNEQEQLISQVKTGSINPIENQQIKSATARLFELNLQADEQATLLIRLYTPSVYYIPINIYTPEGYQKYEQNKDIKNLLILLLMLALSGYFFVINLIAKDKVIALVASITFFYAAYEMAYLGYLQFYLLANLNIYIAAISSLILGASFIVLVFYFYKRVLGLYKSKPWLYLINFLIYSFVFLTLIAVVSGELGNKGLVVVGWVVFITHYLSLFFCLIQPIILITHWKKRKKNTFWFIVAVLIILFVANYKALDTLGVMNKPFFKNTPVYTLSYGLIIVALMTGFILRYYYNLQNKINLQQQIMALQNEKQEALEEQVASRTQELKLALTARRNLLAHIGHDLRSPLAGMLTSISSWQAGDKKHDHPELIKSYVHQQLDLIKELLEFSRAELTQIESLATPGYLASFLANLNQHASLLANKDNLIFITNFASNLPATLYLDFKLVHKVLTNLLNNALKYTQQHNFNNPQAKQVLFSVELITSANQPGSQFISFKVEDQAVQLSQKETAQLKQAFIRGFNAGSAEGYGLGLAIVNQLLDALNTQLEVTPSKLGGNCFGFKLPLKLADESLVNTVLEGFSNLDLDGENKLILLVDDEFMIREVATDLLEGFNFEVIAAETGKEALKVLQEHPVDLLITDQQMPQMHGWELLKQAKKIQPNLKTLLYSAGLPNPPLGYEDLKFTAQLLKPAQEDTFLQQVKGCLS